MYNVTGSLFHLGDLKCRRLNLLTNINKLAIAVQLDAVLVSTCNAFILGEGV